MWNIYIYMCVCVSVCVLGCVIVCCVLLCVVCHCVLYVCEHLLRALPHVTSLWQSRGLCLSAANKALSCYHGATHVLITLQHLPDFHEGLESSLAWQPSVAGERCVLREIVRGSEAGLDCKDLGEETYTSWRDECALV